MNTISPKTIKAGQRGSVILEALISVLIFSIGILAIIGLQAASISNSAAAKYRTDASLLANQIIGEMWVNDKTTAALQANFNSPNGANYLTWAQYVATALPGVASSPLYAPTIAIDNTGTATITLHWRAPSESTAHQYTVTAQITP